MNSNQTAHPHLRQKLFWEGMREQCWSCHVLLSLAWFSGPDGNGMMQGTIEELSDGTLSVRCASCHIINLFRSL